MSDDHRFRVLQKRVRDEINELESDSKTKTQISSAFSLFQDFEMLISEVNRAKRRNRLKNLGHVEDSLSQMALQVMSLKKDRSKKSLFKEWLHNYWYIWQNSYSSFWFAFFIFFSSSFVGYFLGRFETDYMPLLLGTGFMEEILEQNKWFESLNKAPMIGAYKIALNNVMVTLKVFALGALFGLGGVLLLFYNGFFFGAIMGFCYANGFDKYLGEFVMAHGPLELTIIIVGGMASMMYGRHLFSFRAPDFKKHLGKSIKDAFILVNFSLPWLVLAAIIEGFVSPKTGLNVDTKIIVGVVAFVAYWIFNYWPFFSGLLKRLARSPQSLEDSLTK